MLQVEPLRDDSKSCDFCDHPSERIFLVRDKRDRARRACVRCIEAVLLKVIALLCAVNAVTPVLDLV